MGHAATTKHALGFPVTDTLLANFFDDEVEKLGRTCVRKKASVAITSSGAREYKLTPDDISPAIYKVEVGEKLVPFVPEASINSTISDSDVSNIGFYYKTKEVHGRISSLSTTDPCILASIGEHHLETDDVITISEVEGMFVAATDDPITTVHPLNGVQFAVN